MQKTHTQQFSNVLNISYRKSEKFKKYNTKDNTKPPNRSFKKSKTPIFIKKK